MSGGRPNRADSAPGRRGVTVLLLVTAALGPACASVVYAVLEVESAVAAAAYYGSKLTFALLPVGWLVLVARRPARVPVWQRAGVAAGVGFGAAAAVSALALHHFVLADHLDPTRLRHMAQSLGALKYYVVFGLFLCVVNSAFEEYYWRWFVFGRLRELTPVGLAVAGSALAFGLHHGVVIQAYFGSAALTGLLTSGVVIGGAAWAWLYHRYGNLYAAWISHLIVDVALIGIGYDLLGLS